MTEKNRLLILVLFISISTALFCRADAPAVLEPRPDHAEIARLLSKRLPETHITHKVMNDEVSARAWNNYLTMLDREHVFFLKADIDAFAANKSKLDDQLIAGDLSFAFQVFNIFKERIKNRCEYVQKLLDKGLNVDEDETYTWNRENAPWPRDEKERDEIWRKRIKNEYVQMIVESRLTEKKDQKVPPADPLKTIGKNYSQLSKRIEKSDAELVMERYLCAFTHAYDPHCEYMTPDSVDEFDIAMKLSLGGIGAVMSTEDSGTGCKVTKINPDSPSGRDTREIRLRAGDRIIAVAQGDEPPVDVTSLPLYKIVRLIRGKKGTKVVLTVISDSDPSGNTTRKIDLIRDEVKIEDGSASFKIKQAKGTDGVDRKLAVINLPGFYGDAKGAASHKANAKSCSKDVEKILREIKKQGADGIILDLRHNGGGSLMEAILMTGLFIESGPVVFVMEDTGSPKLLGDTASHLLYSGPLIVLVDRLSASASEVVAGALQDHGRGMIVGDSKTHGKGSVQTFLNIGTNSKAGSIKVTNSLYYRITGSSTQLKGVTADIILPSFLDSLKTGEDFLPDALEWTMIRPCRFKPFADMGPLVRDVEEKSIKRRNADKSFIAYTNTLGRLEAINKMEEVPLKLDKRLEFAKTQKELRKMQESGEESAEGEEKKDVKKKEKNDIVLNETLNILADLATIYPVELKDLDKNVAPQTENATATEDSGTGSSDIPEAKKKEIVELISKLGDKDAKVRKEASLQLRKMGKEALPVLKEHQDNSDPEIRDTIRELLKQ